MGSVNLPPDGRTFARKWAELVRRITELERRLSRSGRDAGKATLTWPGTGTVSNVLHVPHGLGVVPKSVQVTNSGNTGVSKAPSLVAFSYTETDFQVEAFTIDSQTPTNTATTTFAWVADA